MPGIRFFGNRMKIRKNPFKLPDFKDDEKNIKAYTIFVFARNGLIFALILGIIYMLLSPTIVILLTMLLMLATFLGALLFLQDEKLTAAGNVLVFGLWATLFGVSVFQPELNNLSFLALMIITPLISGLIISTRASIILTLVNFVIGYFLITVPGKWFFTPTENNNLIQLFGYAAIFGALPIVVAVNRRVYMRMIEGFRREEMARREVIQTQSKNLELQAHLLERTEKLEFALIKQEELAKQLEKALLDAVELNKVRGRVITTISHEFRTPLTVINTSTDLLENHHDRLSPEKRLKHRNRIKSAIYDLDKLLDNIATVDQLINQGIKPRYARIAFDSFWSDIESYLLAEFDSPRLLFVKEKDETAELQLDCELVQLILLDLISNALKFSEDEVEVRLGFNAEAGSLIIEVKDAGIGIPIEAQPEIFKLLFRAPNALTFPGLGLGLHVVQNIVHALYGQIKVYSDGVGSGTRFEVTLPGEIDASKLLQR